MNTLELLFFIIILLVITYKLKDLNKYIKEKDIKISEIKIDSTGRNPYEYIFDLLTIGVILIFSLISLIGLMKAATTDIPMDSSYLIYASGLLLFWILYKLIFIKKDLLNKKKVKKVII